MSASALARKATAVVELVTSMALLARVKEYAMRLWKLFLSRGCSSDWRQASMKTKMSSAAIPSTMKMHIWLSVVKKVICRIPAYTTCVIGKETKIRRMQ